MLVVSLLAMFMKSSLIGRLLAHYLERFTSVSVMLFCMYVLSTICEALLVVKSGVRCKYLCPPRQ